MNTSKRSGIVPAILFVLIVLQTAAPALADGDRVESELRMHVFYGSVLNRFSHRPAPGSSEDGDTNDETYSVVGLQFQYPFNLNYVKGVEIFGNFRHGNRQGDGRSTPASGGAPVGDAILSSETIEWHVGLKLMVMDLLSTEARRKKGGEPTLFLSTRYGFASPETGPGDFIDDFTYAALGIELRSGPHRDTYLSFGYGRTDIFAENTHRRWKGEAGFSFHFPTKEADGTVRYSPHSLFLLGIVDMDMKDGSDDYRMMLGYRFGVGDVLWGQYGQGGQDGQDDGGGS